MAKKILKMLASLFLITILGVGAFAFTIYNQSTSELAKTYKSFENESKVIDATKPLTILLMGVDTGTGSRSDKWEGNSDSMILLTVNPETKETSMMSLERDILTQIDENGESVQAKLNAAYANGGAKLAISTIQKLMNVDIDRYVLINMAGLVQLVDAVGGIQVENKFDFPISIVENEPEYTATIEPGKHQIDGDQALVYARMRYQDPEGDYGRQKRQREVIQKVVQKVLSLNSVSHYQAILRAISNNMQTNIDLSSSSIPKLLGYQDSFKKINNYQLRGEDATLPDGGSYQIVTKEHLLSMQNTLRKALGKNTVDDLKSNAVLYENIYGYSPTKTSSQASSSDTVASSSEAVPESSQVVDTESVTYTGNGLSVPSTSTGISVQQTTPVVSNSTIVPVHPIQ